MASDLDTSTELDALRERIQTLPWFHQIDLGNGLVTPGRTTRRELGALADAMFGSSLAGKTVLDIGCYDGFFSFEAHKRGAARVLATDYYIWTHDHRCRQAFEIARSCVAPAVEDRVIPIDDLSVESVGQFNIVLFSGVFYHLRHPLQTLEHIADLASDTLILETYLDATDIGRPAMIFYPTTELNGDPTNWWGPNASCIEAMLRDVGFPEVERVPHPNHPGTRGLFRARRRASAQGGPSAAGEFSALRREFRSIGEFDGFVSEQQDMAASGRSWLEAAAEDAIVQAAQRSGITTDFDGPVPVGDVQVTGPDMREHLMAAGLNARQRAILELTQEFLGERGIGEADARIYAHEASTSLAAKLRDRFTHFTATEYERDDAGRDGEICRSGLPDAALDLIISSDVFEHVPSIDAALQEAARTLRPGGRMIGTFPFLYWHANSVRFAATIDGAVVHLHTPIYHGDPAAPNGGALVYELPGWDIVARARAAGFADARMLLWADAARGIVASHPGNPIRPRGIFVAIFDR